MAKSVYSLVLSDDVVAAIDVLAARQGYSRSALINHVLANYASLTTPETQSREIVAQAGRAAEGKFSTSQTPAGTLTLRTALRYRYNPSVQYVVQITAGEDMLGQIRVSLRSQNEALLQHLEAFFMLWTDLEQQAAALPAKQASYNPQINRYVRTLRKPQGAQGADTGQAITDYICLLDECLKSFFAHSANPSAARSAAEQRYRSAFPLLGLAMQL